MLCGITETQFSDFQNHFREAQLRRTRQGASLQGDANLPSKLQKSRRQF